MAAIDAVQVSVHVEPAPQPDEYCQECNAPWYCFEKHPALIGGNCAVCGHTWLPGLTFSEPQEITLDLTVEPADDGGAVLSFG